MFMIIADVEPILMKRNFSRTGMILHRRIGVYILKGVKGLTRSRTPQFADGTMASISVLTVVPHVRGAQSLSFMLARRRFIRQRVSDHEPSWPGKRQA
jgi:hypothetical protein